MPKKLLPILVLSFLVVTVLLGCGQQPSSVEPTSPSPPPPPPPPSSTPTPTQLPMLSITEGDVFVMKSGTESWVEAQVGMTLEMGDTIKAGDDSRAVITFFEGSTIELEASTKIDVVELNIAADTGSTAIRLGQEIGKTFSRVEKLADPASRYEIETPDAAAVIRGTTVIVDAREGETTIGCENGTVWGSPRDVDVEVEIRGGWQCSFTRGQLPGALVQLSAPAEEDEDRGGGGGGGGGGTRRIAAIAIAKAANCTTVHEGDEFTYTYNVINAGNTPLYNVSVTDDKVSLVTYQSGDSDHDGKLDTRETWVFTASFTVGPDDPSPLVNIATATASSSAALGRTVSHQTSASVTILRPAIAITKTANCTTVHEGAEITYTYNVTNPGNTPLSSVSVSDNITSPVTYQSGDNGNNKLDVAETWTFSANYAASGDDPSPLVNTATASGIDDLSQNVTAQDSASVTILRPAIAMTKTAEPTEVYEGDKVTYTYNVTNPGNTPLSNVSVSDNITSPVTHRSGDDGNNKLDVGETWTFSADYTASGDDPSPLVNTATASGTDALGKIVNAQASVNVTILPYGIRIELTWETDDTDFDAHFIRPGGEMWNVPDDCYYRNMNPDWGRAGVSEDNPSLNQDLTSGYGPENTTLKLPYEEGLYQYKVHYYSDHEHGSSTARVKIWINGIKVAEYSKEMSSRQTWDCASIEWPSGNVAPASDPVDPFTTPEVEK
jgi:uncharacterized repeat protein (TIGR01451 family)